MDSELDTGSMFTSTHSNMSSRKKSAAIWILKVQETLKLTQSTMEQILKDITAFFEESLIELGNEVKAILLEAGIEIAQLPDLAKLFSPDSPYAKPFGGLETQHLQMKFYKEEMDLVVCSILPVAFF